MRKTQKKEAKIAPIHIPLGEVEAAMSTFNQTGALCFARGSASNDGFAATLSFNSCPHQSSAGTLEIAYRAATIEFAPPNTNTNAEWSLSVVDLVKEHTKSITTKHSTTHSSSNTSSEQSELQGETKLKFGFPFFGLDASAKAIGKDSTDQTTGLSRNLETTSTSFQQPIEVQRGLETFRIGLNAEPGSDLVRFNHVFSRLPILSFDEPHEIVPSEVTITITSPLTQEGEATIHSLHIRQASGVWSGLTRSPNHAVLSELLLSKFLTPLHAKRKLWPTD